MFEVAEIRHKLTKKQFNQIAPNYTLNYWKHNLNYGLPDTPSLSLFPVLKVPGKVKSLIGSMNG